METPVIKVIVPMMGQICHVPPDVTYIVSPLWHSAKTALPESNQQEISDKTKLRVILQNN